MAYDGRYFFETDEKSSYDDTDGIFFGAIKIKLWIKIYYFCHFSEKIFIN